MSANVMISVRRYCQVSGAIVLQLKPPFVTIVTNMSYAFVRMLTIKVLSLVYNFTAFLTLLSKQVASLLG